MSSSNKSVEKREVRKKRKLQYRVRVEEAGVRGELECKLRSGRWYVENRTVIDASHLTSQSKQTKRGLFMESSVAPMLELRYILLHRQVLVKKRSHHLYLLPNVTWWNCNW